MPSALFAAPVVLSFPFAIGAPAPLTIPAPVTTAAMMCPEHTKLVAGTHYENVERLCLDFHQNQCWTFFPDVVALESPAVNVATCMDEFEWPNQEGALPPVMMSYTEATEECRGVGKRLCSEYEWEVACEGPRSLPFSYGYAYEEGACVNEKPYRPYSQNALSSGDHATREREIKRLYQAEPSGSRPKCRSGFGVADLIGNVEEWVNTSRKEWAYPSSLKGGYWSKAWSGCRGTNDSHGPAFRFYEIGFRCCTEPTTR